MKISTSILNAPNRKEAVEKLNKTKTNYIHIDVMDGKFVKNTQFNTYNEIETINNTTTHNLDIHLMVENPSEYIKNLNNMKIEYITIHIEINTPIKNLINQIKKKGYKVGLAIKPKTNIKTITPYLKDIDLLLIMSVEPGQGGQKFIPTTKERINLIKEITKKYNNNIKIEVDGGINNEIITNLENVDIAVVGSYITTSTNYSEQIDTLINSTPKKTN